MRNAGTALLTGGGLHTVGVSKPRSMRVIRNRRFQWDYFGDSTMTLFGRKGDPQKHSDTKRFPGVYCNGHEEYTDPKGKRHFRPVAFAKTSECGLKPKRVVGRKHKRDCRRGSD